MEIHIEKNFAEVSHMVRGKGQRFCHYGLTKGGNSMMLIMVGYVPLGKRKKDITQVCNWFRYQQTVHIDVI